MRILSVHANYIEYEPKTKAIKDAKEVEKRSNKIEDCLVIFTSVEKRDEENLPKVIEKYVEEIKNIASQVKASKIVLYPYAHLSSSLSSPAKAEIVLNEASKILSKTFKVFVAPFGWYKAFTISCKGHPLSELSREFTAEGRVKREESLIKEEPFDLDSSLKKLSKNSMSSEPGKNGLKSNVELGKELDIYFVNEIIGSGLPLLTPKGATIKRELERFIVDEELKRGYLHTSTPVMAKSDLYKISGHWQHYKENMFTFNAGHETFALRPMTCPFHFAIYKSQPRSYKELPIRYAEIANLFRNEKSGELMGLTRIRQFTLADAHVICKPEQLEAEFAKIIDLINFVTSTLKMDGLWYRFSKWDKKNKEKYVDDPKAWESTQTAMKRILDKLKIKYIEAENEAAFYGPKLDVQYKNVFGKEDTLLTVQIDFALPSKFDLTYVDEENNKMPAIVIHRSSLGCLERTMAYILEKTQGNLPLWLSPVQVKILTINDKAIPFAKKIVNLLSEKGVRVELDDTAETMGKKVKLAQLEKVNYMLTIGDKEVEKKNIAVRSREGEVKFDVAVDKFVEKVIKEIKERK